jgi:outer membrane protein insertion porin family
VTIYPGQILDIRELKASERRLLASSLFHVDPASNVRPKITYRIPEDADLEFAEEPSSVRGQSPDDIVPAASPPGTTGWQQGLPAAQHATPVAPIDMHVFCDDEAHFDRWQATEGASAEAASAVDLPPDAPAMLQPSPTDRGAYELLPSPGKPVPAHTQPAEVVIRGQSPEPEPLKGDWWAPSRSQTRYVVRKPGDAYGQLPTAQPLPTAGYVNPAYATAQQPAQGYVNQAYAAVPTGGSPGSPYGGQAVRATGPESAPVAQVDPGVQPAQYSSQIQPPAGSVAPTPLSPQGPLPYYSVDPSSPFYAAPELPAYPEGTVDIFIEGQETQTGRLMMGVGVNSDAGVVGNIVVDERNFDWTRFPTSWEDFRNGSAWRGAGQRFRIDASPGSQVSRYLVSFQEPYLFDRPVSLGLSGSYYDRRFNDWDEQRIGGRVSLGYQWVERDLSAVASYRGENINIHDPSVPFGFVPELDEVLGDNVLHGFRMTLINDTRDNAFLATQGHYFEIGGEQVIGSFDYPRVDIDFRKYFMLYERPDHSGRHVLSLSTTIGYSGTHTPIYEHYFAGGFSTMRGFDFRGASPINQTFNVELGGEFQWLNSVQYLFPITADDMLHGVVFCDFGTVERNVSIHDFRVAPGAGLRITVPAMGPAPIALDFAWAVERADFDDPEVFSFSLGFSR